MPGAYTLAEINKLSNNRLLSGVIDNIITASDILPHLPFKPLTNKALVYNRELTLPSASFIDRGSTITSSTVTLTEVTATLKILVSQMEVDQFDVATRSDTNDPEQIAVTKASKAVGRLFDRKFIYGNASSVSTEMNGLHALCSTSSPDMTVNAGSGTTPAGLQIEDMFEMVERIEPGQPDIIIMNKLMRRRLSLWAQGTLSNLFSMTIDAGLGKVATHFDGIPIVICDHITNVELMSGGEFSTETGGSGTGAGGVSTSIFAVKFGESDAGVVGLDAKGGVGVEDVGIMEKKDAKIKRVKWYCALALYGNYSLSRIDGIAPATAIAI